jgi:squalene cyclase
MRGVGEGAGVADGGGTWCAAGGGAGVEAGGWRVEDADVEMRVRGDKKEQPLGSDGYATGRVVLALEATEPKDATVKRGIAWLKENQRKDGSWVAASMHKERDPESDASLFMTDAATGCAVMALEAAR